MTRAVLATLHNRAQEVAAALAAMEASAVALQERVAANEQQIVALQAAEFAAGTQLVFPGMATAPLGWVKRVDVNDAALKIVSGTPSNGGTEAFSSLFSRTQTDGFQLTTTYIPAHYHGVSANTGTENRDHSHSGYTNAVGTYSETQVARYLYQTPTGHGLTTTGNIDPDNASYNLSHTHTVQTYGVSHTHYHSISANTSTVGSGAAHAHGMDMRLKFVGAIIAIKE